MGCYFMICHNTYGYSLLFYKVYHEEGESRQLEFWLEKEQILETYSAQLQKTTLCLGDRGRPPRGAPPCLLGSLVGLQRPSSAI